MSDPILTPEQVTDLRAKAEAATAGPWTVETHYCKCYGANGDAVQGFRVPEVDTVGDGECEALSQADAEHIAAFNPATAIRLCESLEALRAQVASLTAERDDWRLAFKEADEHVGKQRAYLEEMRSWVTTRESQQAEERDTLRARVAALVAKWRQNADMLAAGTKGEWADPSVGMQRACADQLEAAVVPAQPEGQ